MLEAKNISASFGKKHIFSDVSLAVRSGEIYCISGTSGCGKTTLGRILAGLHQADKGNICCDGQHLASSAVWPVQYLYQSPLTAMNPRWHIEKIVREAGSVNSELARTLGVQLDWLQRYPHELSGGQLQRVAILRALGTKPRYLIADEITSALDPVAQAQIWGILITLAAERKLGIVAISHDMALLNKIGCTTRHLKLQATFTDELAVSL